MIAYGKVMDDEAKTVADYKIVENGFIVMMTVKVSILYLYSKRSHPLLSIQPKQHCSLSKLESIMFIAAADKK